MTLPPNILQQRHLYLIRQFIFWLLAFIESAQSNRLSIYKTTPFFSVILCLVCTTVN